MEKNYSLKPGWKQKNPATQRVAKNWSANQILGFGYSLEIPD